MPIVRFSGRTIQFAGMKLSLQGDSTVTIPADSRVNILPNGDIDVHLVEKVLSAAVKLEDKKLEAMDALLGDITPPRKSTGRPVDPNSAFQRIKAETLLYLNKQGKSTKQDLVAHLQKKYPDINLVNIHGSLMRVPGINRDYGKWMLA